MDVLRQIVQSQMWISPFRHILSHKTQRYHQKLLSQLKLEDTFSSSSLSEMKDESDDDEDDDDDDDDDEMLCDDWMNLIGLESESNELYNILYSTMRGEGNISVLLFGRNGFGKSSLLSSVMQRIENKCGKNRFIYIYLNGDLHETDIESLYEIVSQLAHQNGRSFDFNLFADDIEDDDDDNNYNDLESEKNKKKLKKGDFAENLDFLVNELKKVTMENYEINNRHKRPIYIILDHFELFAKRHKQTLLYNLFDLNQSQSSLLNIIGITNQKSVSESLEKRIRSRFVHKKIFVPQNSFLSENAYKLFYKIIYNSLFIRNYTKYYIEGNNLLNKKIKTMIKKYNDWIDNELFDNFEFDQYLRNLHRFGYSPSEFLIISGKLSSIIFNKEYYLKRLNNSKIKEIIKEIDRELFEDPFLRMINDLTINELIILIVAAKFEVTKRSKFNFEIIYQTLKNVQKQDSMNIIMDKHKYFQCYRQLINMKFLVSVSNANKINIANSSNIMLSKIFHSNFDYVRLKNELISGSDILRYISINIKDLPTWIDKWLLNNKTYICN